MSNFTDLLNDFLDAKKEYEEARESAAHLVYFYDSNVAQRYRDAQDALNAAFNRVTALEKRVEDLSLNAAVRGSLQ